MSDIIYKVVFIDGQTIFGKFGEYNKCLDVTTIRLTDIIEIRYMPLSPKEVGMVVSTPQHMKEMFFSIGSFVKYFGEVDEEGRKFYEDQWTRLKAEKAGIVTPSTDDIGKINKRR